MMSVTEEELCAFADGMLAAEETARIALLVAADPVLSRRVEDMRRQASLLKGAFDGLETIPVPDHLAAQVRKAPPPVAARRPFGMRDMAVAAAAALAAFTVAGVSGIFSGGESSGGALIASKDGLVAGGRLQAALETQMSGPERVEGIAIALSLPAEGESFCRVFDLQDAGAAPVSGLACREDDSWSIVALSQGAGGETARGFARASGPLTALVAEAANARRLGDPLDAQAERALIDSGWRAAQD